MRRFGPETDPLEFRALRVPSRTALPMRLVLIGAFLILLPAIVVVLYFWGSLMMFPALASLFVAALPFLAFALVIPRGGDDGGSPH